MQFHIHHTEQELTTGHHSGTEGLLFLELFEHFFREGFARLVVLGESVDGGFVVAPVFHELGGEFDGVPFDAVDSGYVSYCGAGEHVLQSVASLVEESFHLPKRHQGRLIPHRRTPIASQIRHRHIEPQRLAFSQTIGHPRPAPLIRRSRIGIQIKTGNVFPLVALIVQGEEPDVGMPHLHGPRGISDFHVENAFDQSEHSLQYRIQSEVGSQFLFFEIECLFLEAFDPEGGVPGHEFGEIGFGVFGSAGGAGEIGGGGEFSLGGGEGFFEDEVGEVGDGGDVGCHFGGETHFGVIVKPEQTGHLLPQLQNLLNDEHVILSNRRFFFLSFLSLVVGGLGLRLRLRGRKLRSPRQVPQIHLLPDVPIRHMLHGRNITRSIQGDPPRSLGGIDLHPLRLRLLLLVPLRLRLLDQKPPVGFGPHGQGTLRHVLDVAWIRHGEAERLGGIEDVVRKGRGEFGEAEFDLVEAYLFGRSDGEADSLEGHGAECVGDGSSSLGREEGRGGGLLVGRLPRGSEGGQRVVEDFGLSELHAGLDDLGLIGLVLLAQLVRVLDPVQVAGDAPRVAEGVLHLLQGGEDFVVGDGGGGGGGGGW
mmetsp:Transcript_4918/g.10155  ORF Transcript_4918/g.10155 Transcript_4918/m.10155 type:complete len:591 (+) Transcript_4918:470-2242(+)